MLLLRYFVLPRQFYLLKLQLLLPLFFFDIDCFTCSNFLQCTWNSSWPNASVFKARVCVSVCACVHVCVCLCALLEFQKIAFFHIIRFYWFLPVKYSCPRYPPHPTCYDHLPPLSHICAACIFFCAARGWGTRWGLVACCQNNNAPVALQKQPETHTHTLAHTRATHHIIAYCFVFAQCPLPLSPSFSSLSFSAPPS